MGRPKSNSVRIKTHGPSIALYLSRLLGSRQKSLDRTKQISIASLDTRLNYSFSNDQPLFLQKTNPLLTCTFWSTSNLIFTACVSCKIQVRNRQKIKFIKIHFWNLIFRISSTDQQEPLYPNPTYLFGWKTVQHFERCQ